MDPPLLSEVPSSHEDPVTYTIVMRGTEFQLSRSQISFDSPNYFTACFSESSGFAEATERVLRLDRNPALFELIVEYLSGYPILPLEPDSLPHGMGITVAQRYLLADAQFYGLEKLCDLLRAPRARTDLTWAGYANEVVSLQEVLEDRIPSGIVRKEDGSIVSAKSGLPVLVRAQSVLFRILCSSHNDHSSPQFEIVTPRPPPIEHGFSSGRTTHTAMPFLDTGESVVTRITGLEDAGLVSIDNIQFYLRDVNHGIQQGNMGYLQGALIYHRFTHTSVRQTDEATQTTSYTYWADSVLCSFVPRVAGRQGVVLIKAWLRSKQEVLSELGPGAPYRMESSGMCGSMLDAYLRESLQIPTYH